MKKQFGHLLPLNEKEVDAIWNEGILSVDANVLLDLYRYHSDTRDTLIRALRGFKGRLWLSHQAASEFIRNRARAASGVEKELDDAENDLKTLEVAIKKATDDLRGRRPLPSEVSQKLKADSIAAIRAAKDSIEVVRTRHADSDSTDVVLDEVLSLFDDCVGCPPTEAELVNLRKEAERRIKDKVPPGYMDAKKDDSKAHGDYFVWHQVLQKAKSDGRPVIFVTSEQKEDWWERARGKTVGPRHELLEEAHRVAGHRVLILQTESFLTRAAQRVGEKFTALMRNDIRTTRDDQEIENIITDLIHELGDGLIDTDSAINNLIADTNASDWHVDCVEVTEFGPLSYANCSAPFVASLYYSGDQDEERAWCGTKINAEIRGMVGFEGGSWVISDYDVVNANIRCDEPGDWDE